jgi:hypothetical protein
LRIHTQCIDMKPIDRLNDDELVRLARQAVAQADAPAAMVEAAIGLWPAAPTAEPLQMAAQAAQAVRTALNRVAAVLSFDSWAVPATAMGMRSMPSATRHLLFSAQGRDVDLRIIPGLGHFTVAGQVLGPDESGAVQLRHRDGAVGERVSYVGRLDSLGEFRLDAVESGTYQMTLLVGDDEVVLPLIEVGEPNA